MSAMSCADAQPISVALVGAGDIFSHHANGILAHPELYRLRALSFVFMTLTASRAGAICSSD